MEALSRATWAQAFNMSAPSAATAAEVTAISGDIRRGKREWEMIWRDTKTG